MFDLADEVSALKRERNAVVLAHSYQPPPIQDAADFVGDSLGLSRQAAATGADVIAFCGVHFMVETAKILNPSKRVILPEREAGCSLADSCQARELEAFLKAHAAENYYVVAYINCSAAVKALSDVICTSGNAVDVVNAAPKERRLLFVPDENLGSWVMEQTGRPMTLWKGGCHVHVELSARDIEALSAAHPGAPVVVHPECRADVRTLADIVCSTERMLDYCGKHSADTFIIVTEQGMLHRLHREVPGKNFVAVPAECRYMKMNTLEKLRDALKTLQPEIVLPEPLRARAEVPIRRMLSL